MLFGSVCVSSKIALVVMILSVNMMMLRVILVVLVVLNVVSGEITDEASDEKNGVISRHKRSRYHHFIRVYQMPCITKHVELEDESKPE